MVQLGVSAECPVGLKVVSGAIAVMLKAGNVADGGIQPNIEILARFPGNLKTEVGGVAANVPLLQASLRPLPEFVGDLRLQCIGVKPFLKHCLKFREFEEQMGRLFFYGFCARYG